ncbi:MAG: signal transduction histidine kinase [Cycloclasticus sp.]|jgi:signal transduction histidine kinase
MLSYNRLCQTALLILLLPFALIVAAQADPEIMLTEAERAWLKDHPVIRLASDLDWPPFEWADEESQYQGIAADYMGLIEKKLGLRFEMTKNMSWPNVVEAVKKRQLDVFSCVAKNAQRQEYVSFTRPYLSFPMVIITTDDINFLDGINDLTDLKVGVVKGYATHEYLASKHPDIQLLVFANSKEGLHATSQGKIDAFVDNIATASNIIQTSGLTNLKISGEMPIRYELGMAVRKDWPELVNILQRALDSISQDQRKLIHNKWIGVRYEHGVDYDLLWKSLAVFLLVASFLYYYNRKLSREIVQRKSAQKAALTAKDDAEKANRAKSEFLSVISHELRTPLTSIKGTLGLLSSGKFSNLPEKTLGLLKIANDNSDRLIMLINDILDIEKLMAEKMSFQNKPLVVGELIEKAVISNQGYAHQYDVELLIEKNKCADLILIADENRLIQVLSNFLSNAIKYSPTAGQVRITTDCVDQTLRVCVIDQGNGVPPSFHDRIFSYFSQADSSDTREKGGTGLGLAISREIIKRQGGTIGFSSPAGEGATFYFELTVSQAHE